MEADWAFGTRSMEFTSSSMRSLNTQIKAELALPPLTQERTLAQIFPKYHRNCNTRRGSSHRGHFQHCPSFSTEFFQFHLLATEEDLAHWVRGYLESARWFLHYWLLVICNETKHTTKTPQLMPVYHLGKQSKLSEWTLLICQHIFETKKKVSSVKKYHCRFPCPKLPAFVIVCRFPLKFGAGGQHLEWPGRGEPQQCILPQGCACYLQLWTSKALRSATCSYLHNSFHLQRSSVSVCFHTMGELLWHERFARDLQWTKIPAPKC